MKNIALIYFIFFSFELLIAQEIQDSAFSTITVSAGLTQNTFDADLKEYWKDSKGGSVSFSTPFYIGQAAIGLDFVSITSKSIKQPDYKTFFIHSAWRQGLNLGTFAKILVGVKFGTYVMLFDDAALSQFESNESELAIAATGQLNLNLSSRIAISFGSEYATVFTKKRMKLNNYNVGISYKFDSPSWLKESLE